MEHRPHLFILNADHSVTPTYDLVRWAERFELGNRHVQETMLGKEVRISTVFLGIDHNFGGNGPPIVFETMVFGGALDQEQERYCTWDEAAAGHARWVEAAALMLEGST